jgi:hypothetical protein
MADDASHLSHLSNHKFLTYFNSFYLQHEKWKLWTPTPSMTSVLILALHRTRSKPASFLSVPSQPTHTGGSGPPSASVSLLTPLISKIIKPIALLQVFAQHYRTGRIMPSQRAVRSCTVKDAIRSIGQIFVGMGAMDPCLTGQGKIDFRLQQQLAAYTKKDPPPNWVKPIPVSVIRHVMYATHASALPCNMAVTDMIALAFFFLLCPG